MIGVKLVKALSGFLRQDTSLGALLQSPGGLLNRAGHAVDAGHVDGTVFHTVRDQVAILNECDGTAGGSLGADVADSGAAGKAVVGQIAQVAVKLVIPAQVLQVLAKGLAGDGHHI